MTSSSATLPNDCLNCGIALSGRYCANCGQKATPAAPTLHEFLHDAAHEFLHVDGKIVQTLKLLFMHPGALTGEAFAGRRASYVPPLRLYLIFSVVYFSAVALLPPPVVLTDRDRGESGGIRVSSTSKEVTPEELIERVREVQTHWMPRAMFVLVPLAALLIMPVTRRTGRTFIQHLYFALHAHAAYFAGLTIVSAIEALRIEPLGRYAYGLLAVWGTVYVVMAFRRTYGGGWPLATGRAAFAGLLYGLAVALALIAMILAPLFLART